MFTLLEVWTVLRKNGEVRCAIFKIDSPGKHKAPTVGRCGNMNSLKETDFVWVKRDIQPVSRGIFSSYEIARVENFQKTGRYKITFFYSTKSDDMATYFGDDNGASKKAIKNDSLRYHILS